MWRLTPTVSFPSCTHPDLCMFYPPEVVVKEGRQQPQNKRENGCNCRFYKENSTFHGHTAAEATKSNGIKDPHNQWFSWSKEGRTRNPIYITPMCIFLGCGVCSPFQLRHSICLLLLWSFSVLQLPQSLRFSYSVLNVGLLHSSLFPAGLSSSRPFVLLQLREKVVEDIRNTPYTRQLQLLPPLFPFCSAKVWLPWSTLIFSKAPIVHSESYLTSGRSLCLFWVPWPACPFVPIYSQLPWNCSLFTCTSSYWYWLCHLKAARELK